LAAHTASEAVIRVIWASRRLRPVGLGIGGLGVVDPNDGLPGGTKEDAGVLPLERQDPPGQRHVKL
jgi:hypothetical protein